MAKQKIEEWGELELEELLDKLAEMDDDELEEELEEEDDLEVVRSGNKK